MDRLVGRDRELARVRHLLEEVVGGSPRALVVHGEAGVGKTRLVRESLADPGLAVAWGTCVHFGASTLPFAPLVTALRPWLSATDGDLDAARLIPVIDATLQRLAGERPVVLVIDDLQWADVSSLDALAFVIAGFRDQRLAVLATCRDEERPAGSVLNGWLADVRRMPGFEEMHLGRLDPAGTEDLVAGYLGRPVDLGLVAEVHERSGGNAYLAELLVRDLPPGARQLPLSAPAALAQALTARWHSLSERARTVVQVLAVGGRPRSLDLLTRVAGAHGVDVDQVEDALQEAADHGVVTPGLDPVWFRHPLLAEVLDAAVPSTFAARVHASYADLLEAQREVPERRRADDLAVHHWRAGHLEDAYSWSLRAADAAAEADSASEAVHLERACALWPQLPGGVGHTPAAHVALLRRTARVDERLGQLDTAVTHVERAQALVPPDGDPRLSSSLLSQWCELVWQRDAPRRAVRPELFEALRLVDAYPDSPERARALTGLASAHEWDGLVKEARSYAAQAVAVARRCGDAAQLADALSVLARTCGDPDAAMGHVVEAYELARSIGDWERMTDAAIWQVNVLNALDRPRDAMTLASKAAEEGRALGSVAWSCFLAGMSASVALDLGEWSEARRLVRAALADRPVAIPGAGTHLVAARRAVLVGEVAEARAHLDRALSFVPEFFAGLAYESAKTQPLVLFAEGNPERALEWLETFRRRGPTLDPREQLMVLARSATAAAEIAEAARDRGDPVAAAAAAARLDEILDEVGISDLSPRGHRATRYLLCAFEAQRARCRRAPDEELRWEAAAAAAAEAEYPWHRAEALWRQVQAGSRAKAPRGRLAEPLREAHRIASRLGARPLLRDIEQLAESARIPLSGVEEPRPARHRDAGALAMLTDREREVLRHLVAGRSNAEIGHELVISEKTVSVHVSNILRKTGATSRVEAAELARRLS